MGVHYVCETHDRDGWPTHPVAPMQDGIGCCYCPNGARRPARRIVDVPDAEWSAATCPGAVSNRPTTVPPAMRPDAPAD